MLNSPIVMIVDDEDDNRALLRGQVQRLGLQAECVADGSAAINMLDLLLPDLIIVDLMMPQMPGHVFLERVKRNEQTKHIPVVLTSAIDDMDMIALCIERGADDYLVKPINPTLLVARIRSCLQKKQMHDVEENYRRQIASYNAELEERVEKQVKQLSATQLSTIFAMSKLAESRDPETGAHLERMREYCRLIADHLREKAVFRDIVTSRFVDNLYTASPLHDIGKVAIPDNILCKPGVLTREEFEIMKTHTTIGANMLRQVDTMHPGNEFIRFGIEIAETHHEQWSGGGYPRGLAGESIPLVGRILAVGDVYDALTTKRCYKDGFTHLAARDMIVKDAGVRFDPVIVDAFLACEDQFIEIKEKLGDHDVEPPSTLKLKLQKTVQNEEIQGETFEQVLSFTEKETSIVQGSSR